MPGGKVKAGGFACGGRKFEVALSRQASAAIGCSSSSYFSLLEALLSKKAIAAFGSVVIVGAGSVSPTKAHII